MGILWALLAGCLFGAGIAMSGMINPSKVLNFFDVFGSWDPSLALVMAGALAVTVPGYHWVLRRRQPWAAREFARPSANGVDARLLAGAALFGVGWGIAGFCPGGSLPGLAIGGGDVALFVVAMVSGIALAKKVLARN